MSAVAYAPNVVRTNAALVGADHNRYTTVDSPLKLSPADDDTFGTNAAGMLERLVRPGPGSCATMTHAAPSGATLPVVPATSGLTVAANQAQISAPIAPAADILRQVGQQQGAQGLLAVAASAKPIASMAPPAAASVTVQSAAAAERKNVIPASAEKHAAFLAGISAEHDQRRRIVPFTFLIHRTPEQLAGTSGVVTFRIPLADDAANSHVIVEHVSASISTNSIIKTGVHFPALLDSHKISYDDGSMSGAVHMLCPAPFTETKRTEAYRRQDIPNLYFAARYGDIRAREQIKASIIPDEHIADRYRVSADSAIARVMFSPEKMKEYHPQLLTGKDGKDYIETVGRKGFDTIAAFIEKELFDKTADHGKNIIDPNKFQVELVPIGIGAKWTNLPGVDDQELLRKQPIEVMIRGEMSVFLVPKPSGSK